MKSSLDLTQSFSYFGRTLTNPIFVNSIKDLKLIFPDRVMIEIGITHTSKSITYEAQSDWQNVIHKLYFPHLEKDAVGLVIGEALSLFFKSEFLMPMFLDPKVLLKIEPIRAYFNY